MTMNNDRKHLFEWGFDNQIMVPAEQANPFESAWAGEYVQSADNAVTKVCAKESFFTNNEEQVSPNTAQRLTMGKEMKATDTENTPIDYQWNKDWADGKDASIEEEANEGKPEETEPEFTEEVETEEPEVEETEPVQETEETVSETEMEETETETKEPETETEA